MFCFDGHSLRGSQHCVHLQQKHTSLQDPRTSICDFLRWVRRFQPLIHIHKYMVNVATVTMYDNNSIILYVYTGKVFGYLVAIVSLKRNWKWRSPHLINLMLSEQGTHMTWNCFRILLWRYYSITPSRNTNNFALKVYNDLGVYYWWCQFPVQLLVDRERCVNGFI